MGKALASNAVPCLGGCSAGFFVYWATRVSLEAADRVVDRITERFWLLGEHPGVGKLARYMAPGVRCFPAGNYLIYYRKTRRGTDIPHVFHGARDQMRAFKAPKNKSE